MCSWSDTDIDPNKVNVTINPFTPTSDQEIISPNIINTISSRGMMRIMKNTI